MNAHALHLPEHRGVSRWMLAALAILLAHAAIIATLAFWYTRQPVEPTILPAISVSLAPVESSGSQIQNEDAVGPAMQQAEATPNEPPKPEQPVEKIETPPPPQQQADVTLPQEMPKQVEEPKPQSQPPAPENRAPSAEHIGQFTQAASNAYNALLVGHLERFKRYPEGSHGVSGKVLVQFELNRAGQLISSAVTKSSGNAAIDREALETLRRASPFPAFPAAKPGAQDSFVVPVSFGKA